MKKIQLLIIGSILSLCLFLYLSPSEHNLFPDREGVKVAVNQDAALPEELAMCTTQDASDTSTFGTIQSLAPRYNINYTLQSDNRGIVRDIDVSLNSDRLTIEWASLPEPPADYAYQAYLINRSGGALACGPLTPTENGEESSSTVCDYPENNLINGYHTLRIMQEATLVKLSHPQEPLPALRTLLYEASDTPEQVGYSTGLAQQAQLLLQHAGFAHDAVTDENLIAARRHTEHVLNILYGEADERYGDQDGDGLPTNPGDGYGLLAYSRRVSETLQSIIDEPKATFTMRKQANAVQTVLENIGPAGASTWSDTLIEKAQEALTLDDVAEMSPLTLQMMSFADRIANGEDLDDSGTVDAIPNEGGAATALHHSQRAFDYLLVDYTISKPVAASIVGTIEQGSSGDDQTTDQLQFDIQGLPPLADGQAYWVYLLDSNDVPYPVGMFTEPDDIIVLNNPNVLADSSGILIAIGAHYAETILPEPLQTPMETLLYQATDTPDQVGYAVGLAQQAQKLRQHAGFVQDAANDDNFIAMRRHAEHVLNILYGESDSRYGDQDADGATTNPGDGYGLLVYWDKVGETLDTLSRNIIGLNTQIDPVRVGLSNIHDPSNNDKWADKLIENTEAVLAASTVEDAKPLLGGVVGMADRILNGEDINDSGVVEPIADEGGAYTVYLHTQMLTDYPLEPLFTPAPVPTTVPTHTPTPIPNTASATPTRPPSVNTPAADNQFFEPDNQCSQANLIDTNSAQHTLRFEQQADEDWTYFTAEAGREYLIEARVPPDSTADVTLELHKECDGGADKTQDVSFSPGVRIPFTAPEDGRVYLRTLNHDPARFGSQVSYRLSVQLISQDTVPVGALIIVAGLLKAEDRLQDNIHSITNRVYRLWRSNGYPADRIRYLATDMTLDPNRDGAADVDALASNANLRDAILNWARDKVDAERALTLYMMDHGDVGKFYLDKPRNEILRSADLDEWLDTLEAEVPGLSINVIIEACNSGSFINSPDGSISGPNRLVIASAGADSLAFASEDGAYFSDIFLDGLAKGRNVALAFEDANSHAQKVHPEQVAWLDDDGDQRPNAPQNGGLASQRSFATLGSFDTSAQKWSPYIAQGGIRAAQNATNYHVISAATTNRQEIWADIRDDSGSIKQAWAIIYPPSWQPAASSDEMVPDPAPLPLIDRGNNEYSAVYGEFDQPGTYRILIHAEDEDGLRSSPLELRTTPIESTQQGESRVYLPFIQR